MTVNSLSSVSLEPLLLSFCAARGSRTAQAINNAGCFSVNLLTHRQEDISRHFAGKPSSGALDQLLWEEGYWRVREANASFLCELAHSMPLGDHDLLVGRVIGMSGPSAVNPPLMYFQGGYATQPAELQP